MTLDENAIYDLVTVRAPILPFGDFEQYASEVREAYDALVGKPLESVFTFPARAATQALDSWGTRMAEDSVSGYVEDGKAGVALLDSHKHNAGFFGGGAMELPLGRTFYAEGVGEPVDETPLHKRKEWSDEGLLDLGLQVRAYGFMLRGHFPNGQAKLGTDDAIKGIEGLVTTDVSIGFGSRGTTQMSYVCGVCGLSVFDEDCDHLPLMREEDTGMLGHAWIRGAEMKEVSLVWKGATPGAIVEKARVLAKTGRLAGVELDLLESVWQVRIANRSLAGGPWLAGLPGSTEQEEVNMAEEVRDESVSSPDEEEAAGESIDLQALVAELAQLRTDVDAIVDGEIEEELPSEAEDEDEEEVPETETAAAEEEVSSDEEPSEETRAALAQATDLLRDVRAQVEELKETRAVVAKYMTALVDEAVQARVRAGFSFDEKEYRARLRRMSITEVQQEIADLEGMAKQMFVEGRVTRPAVPGDVTEGPGAHDVALSRM